MSNAALTPQFLLALRNDLEKVRLLAELVRKREKEKLRQAQVIKEVVDNFIFPYYAALRSTLEKVVAMDRGELFFHPVNTAEVPDYADVVKEPMSWSGIEEKLDNIAYLDVAEFKVGTGPCPTLTHSGGHQPCARQCHAVQQV